MAGQDYQDDSGDWFEQNAPPEEPQQQEQSQSYNDPPQEQQSQQSARGDEDDPDPFQRYPDESPSGGGGNDSGGGGNEYPNSDHDRQGPGGEQEAANRAIRVQQAQMLNAQLGIDGGNLESFLSGRNSWEGYLADQVARTQNTPGGVVAPPGTPRPSGAGSGGGFADYGAISGFGAAPAPFGETYSTLARPDYLQGEYKPPVWSEVFKAPSMEDVQAEPGYALGLKEGLGAKDRTAAARGSILSGGTQKQAARYATDYAATKYGESTGRLFDQYQQRYGQFQDSANRSLAARNTNEGAYQTDSGNNLSQYLTRFNAYQTAIGNQRNADNDVWSRTQDQIHNALTAAGLARP